MDRASVGTIFVMIIFLVFAFPQLVEFFKLLSSMLYNIVSTIPVTTYPLLTNLYNLVYSLAVWICSLLYNKYSLAAILFISILLLALEAAWK